MPPPLTLLALAPRAGQGHGTHCAGTALGTLYGVAKDAILHGVRVLSCSGSGSSVGVIAGMDWVVANRINVSGRRPLRPARVPPRARFAVGCTVVSRTGALVVWAGALVVWAGALVVWAGTLAG